MVQHFTERSMFRVLGIYNFVARLQFQFCNCSSSRNFSDSMEENMSTILIEISILISSSPEQIVPCYGLSLKPAEKPREKEFLPRRSLVLIMNGLFCM